MNRATSGRFSACGRRLASSAGRDGDGGELHQLAAGYRPATGAPLSATPAPDEPPPAPD